MILFSMYHSGRRLSLHTSPADLNPATPHQAGASNPAVGDQVKLKATHHAGVPFHNAPGGTKDFQRIPDGTRGTAPSLHASPSFV
jgi:hypothetical protein